MSCHAHAAPDPCPYCEWAASGDPVKAEAAAGRAARVAQPTDLAAQPMESTPVNSVGSPPRKLQFAWVRPMILCPARYVERCGCASPYRCVLRFGGKVTADDCRNCIEAGR